MPRVGPPLCGLCSFPSPRHASECTHHENVRRLAAVALAAEACVDWQRKHDTYKCIHEIDNSDCRACANEPPHFPVGIDEFCVLQSAVREWRHEPPPWATEQASTDHAATATTKEKP